MKNLKIILTIAIGAGMFACSGERKKDTEVTAVIPPSPTYEVQSSTPRALPSPSYTLANLGASSAGRAK